MNLYLIETVMKIANTLLEVLFLAAIFSLAGCSGMDRAKQETIKEHSFDRAERHDVLYTCSCGQNCDCKTVSTKPGKCDCGRPLKWGMFLKLQRMRLFFVNALRDVAVTELIPNTLPGAPVES